MTKKKMLFLLILIGILLIALSNGLYIRHSAEEMLNAINALQEKLLDGDFDRARGELNAVESAFLENAPYWQALQPHDHVGEIYKYFYYVKSAFNAQDLDRTRLYLLQMEYAVWDVLTLNKTAPENVF